MYRQPLIMLPRLAGVLPILLLACAAVLQAAWTLIFLLACAAVLLGCVLPILLAMSSPTKSNSSDSRAEPRRSPRSAEPRRWGPPRTFDDFSEGCTVSYDEQSGWHADAREPLHPRDRLVYGYLRTAATLPVGCDPQNNCIYWKRLDIYFLLEDNSPAYRMNQASHDGGDPRNGNVQWVVHEDGGHQRLALDVVRFIAEGEQLLIPRYAR